MDIIGVFEQGLIFSIALLGVIISFRLLSFPDLTIEGSFTLGTVIFAVAVTNNYGLFPSMLFSVAGGAIAGLITGVLYIYVIKNKLISSIITLTMLYTVNIKILGGADKYIPKSSTIFSLWDSPYSKILILTLILLITFAVIFYLLSTNTGLLIRASGENERLLKSLGYKTKVLTLIGLVLSNSLIAFSGCLFAQYRLGGNINLGNGLLVAMLASMIIGENIIKPTRVVYFFFAALIGAISYRLLYAFALSMDVESTDLRFYTAVLLVILLLFTRMKNKNSVDRNIGSNMF